MILSFFNSVYSLQLYMWKDFRVPHLWLNNATVYSNGTFQCRCLMSRHWQCMKGKTTLCTAHVSSNIESPRRKYITQTLQPFAIDDRCVCIKDAHRSFAYPWKHEHTRARTVRGRMETIDEEARPIHLQVDDKDPKLYARDMILHVLKTYLISMRALRD